MPEKVNAVETSQLKDIMVTITYDPKQINLGMKPKKDFIDKVNMSTNDFLNALSDDFYGAYELTPQSNYVHAHVYVRSVRSSVIGKSRLLDGMIRKIKLLAQDYKYIGLVFVKLCSHYPKGVQGAIDYLSKELEITVDACDYTFDINYIKLIPTHEIVKRMCIKDYFKKFEKIGESQTHDYYKTINIKQDNSGILN